MNKKVSKLTCRSFYEVRVGVSKDNLISVRGGFKYYCDAYDLLLTIKHLHKVCAIFKNSYNEYDDLISSVLLECYS